MKLATNYRKKGASLALCKLHYNWTTGCLAKVHFTSDPMKNIRIHPRKQKKQKKTKPAVKICFVSLDLEMWGRTTRVNIGI